MHVYLFSTGTTGLELSQAASAISCAIVMPSLHPADTYVTAAELYHPQCCEHVQSCMLQACLLYLAARSQLPHSCTSCCAGAGCSMQWTINYGMCTYGATCMLFNTIYQVDVQPAAKLDVPRLVLLGYLPLELAGRQTPSTPIQPVLQPTVLSCNTTAALCQLNCCRC